MTGSNGGNYVLFKKHLRNGLRAATQNVGAPLTKEGLQAIAMLAVLDAIGDAGLTLESEQTAIYAIESTYRTYGGTLPPPQRYKTLHQALAAYHELGLLETPMMEGVDRIIRGKV